MNNEAAGVSLRSGLTQKAARGIGEAGRIQATDLHIQALQRRQFVRRSSVAQSELQGLAELKLLDKPHNLSNRETSDGMAIVRHDLVWNCTLLKYRDANRSNDDDDNNMWW